MTDVIGFFGLLVPASAGCVRCARAGPPPGLPAHRGPGRPIGLVIVMIRAPIGLVVIRATVTGVTAATGAMARRAGEIGRAHV